MYGIRVRNHHGSTDDTTRYYVKAESSRRRLQTIQYNLFDLANHRSKKGSSKAPKASIEPTLSPSPATYPPSTTFIPTQVWMTSSSSSSSKSHKGYKTRSPSTPSPKHLGSSKHSSLYPTATHVPTQTAIPSYSGSSKTKKGSSKHSSLYPTATHVPTQTAIPSYAKSKKGSSKHSSLYPTATHVPTQTAVPSYSSSSKHKASSKHTHPPAPKRGGKGSSAPKGSKHVPTASPVPTSPSTHSPSPPSGSQSKSKSVSGKTKQPAPGPGLTLKPATKVPAGPTSSKSVPIPVSPSSATAAPAPTTAGPPTTGTEPPSAPATSSAPTAATSSAGSTKAPAAPTSSSPVVVSASPLSAPQAAPASSAAPLATTTTAPSLASPVGGGAPSSTTTSPSLAITTPTVSAPVVATPPASMTSGPSLASVSPAASPAAFSDPPAARSSGIVKSFVFGVTYELASSAATSPSANDYQAAAGVTLRYLEQCLQSSSDLIASARGQMLGTTSDNPVRIEYEVSVATAESNALPTSDELGSMIEACIEGGSQQESSLLERMSQVLDAENPFSTATAVSYEIGGLIATDDATEPPELSSEGANNATRPVRVAPFYLAFAEARPNDVQDFDDVRTIIRNHIHVCLRHQYNRTIDVDGLTDNYQSVTPTVQMHWLGVVGLPWTMPTKPNSTEISNDIVRCFQDPILSEVFVRALQNLPDSNGFSSTLGMTCSLSESETETSQSSSNSRLSPGAIAGIVVGVLLYIVMHAICFYYMYQKRRNRNRTNAEPSAAASQHPTTLAWVQPDNYGGGWWSRFLRGRRRDGLWTGRGRTSESDVPRLLSMPYHHSNSGSTPSERSSRKMEDENLNYFMREIDADVISTSSSSKKKNARRAGL